MTLLSGRCRAWALQRHDCLRQNESSMAQSIYSSLKGKSVLITGGASGIGESIARAFHAQGSKVAVLDYNAEAGQALAKELGERVHFEHSDVRDIPAFQAAIRRAGDAIGPITIL